MGFANSKYSKKKKREWSLFNNIGYRDRSSGGFNSTLMREKRLCIPRREVVSSRWTPNGVSQEKHWISRHLTMLSSPSWVEQPLPGPVLWPHSWIFSSEIFSSRHWRLSFIGKGSSHACIPSDSTHRLTASGGLLHLAQSTSTTVFLLSWSLKPHYSKSYERF